MIFFFLFKFRCVELVHEEMQRIIQHCGAEVQQEILRFPKLHEKIIDVVTQLLRRRLPTTNLMVGNLVAIELAYINTKHPDFHDASLVSSLIKNIENEQKRKNISQQQHIQSHNREVINTKAISTDNQDKQAAMISKSNKEVTFSNLLKNSTEVLSNGLDGLKMNAGDSNQNVEQSSIMTRPLNLLSEVPTSQQTTKLSAREQRDCEVIERLIKSYYLIIRKNIQDTVPKAIMHFLVNYVKDNLQSELVTHLYKQDQFCTLLSESEHISLRRKEATEMLNALQKASLIIGEIRETHMW